MLWVVVGKRRFGKTTLLNAVSQAENVMTFDCSTKEDIEKAVQAYRNETMPMDWMIAVPALCMVPPDVRNQAYVLFLQPPNCRIPARDLEY